LVQLGLLGREVDLKDRRVRQAALTPQGRKLIRQGVQARLEWLGELEASIQSLSARQGSVDAVRAELTRLFETAARAVEDVRAVAAAQQEVHAARQAFEAVLARSGEADELAGRIAQRLAAIEEAERRMARLDTLLADVRGSLEGLHGQKVLVDHVMEKSGQLTFQVKEAEAMLSALREERELAGQIHGGLVELRAERRDRTA